jgi:uncharacterized protein
LELLTAILRKGRWFFIKIMGRRRIGKTALIKQALDAMPGKRIFSVQIPDSSPPGVLSPVADAIEMFIQPDDRMKPPTSLAELATAIGKMARKGYVVVLDEFQYFHLEKLRELPRCFRPKSTR